MKKIRPPKYAEKFLRWFIKPTLEEEVLGDLEEKFYNKLKSKPPFKAKINFWYQTINYLRPFAIKNNIITDLNPFFMFNSYFKIAWRGMFKQKLYSLINVSGMTIGMTCFILISLYINYELSYDHHHEKANRIYRVAQEQEGNTFRGTNKFACSSVPVPLSMKAEIPEVESATTMAYAFSLFWKDGQPIYKRGNAVDSSFFDVFSFPVIEGDVSAAIKDRDAIILTESMAKQFFGYKSPIGEMMELRDNRMVVVKAVIENVPNNNHFKFNYLISIENDGDYVGDKKAWRWASNNYWSYVVLKEGADVQKVETAMLPFGEKAAAELAQYNLPFKPKYFLQPLTDIYLHSNINAEIGAIGDIRYLYLAASIALIILLLALINYMNLATARTSQRSKEVGVRKVLGARKKQLVNQFMLESVLLTGFSFLLAIGLANWLMPFFNQLMGVDIPFAIANSRLLLFGLAAVALLLGAISGLYPAILSAAIAPVKALKGNWMKQKRGSGALLRNALVVGQFTAAIILAISSVVIYQQLDFIQTKKIGYNREQIVFVPYGRQANNPKRATLQNELLKHPNIEKVTMVNNLPINTNNQGIVDKWEGKSANDNQLHIYRMYADDNFFDVFEMELVEGRSFSRNFPTDTTEAYILNEAAVKAIGWESAVGKSFRNGKVIGVVKDFHFQPFDLAIEPMQITMIHRRNRFENIVMKVKMDNMEDTKAHIKQTLNQLLPTVIPNVNYLDEAYSNLYNSEKRFGDAFNIFTLIALFIACIGLFGLVTHSVLLRTKEIGIRKVLGASVSSIVGLISKDFLKLVILATLVAAPLAWWGMHTWLQDFAYRIDINWWVFGIVGLVAILIAFSTIAGQSLKAALANPIQAIKTE